MEALEGRLLLTTTDFGISGAVASMQAGLRSGSAEYAAAGLPGGEGEGPLGSSSAAVQIIDNGEMGFSTLGNWSPASGQGYRNDALAAPAGFGNAVASWRFQVSPGRYRVAATWSSHPNRATDAPFSVFDGSSASTTSFLGEISVNQEQPPNDFNDAGGTWEQLGSFTITSGTLLVMLEDAANEFVIADAVRIERLDGDGGGGGPMAPEIEVLENQLSVFDNGTIDFGASELGQPVEKTLTVLNVGTENLALSPFDPAAFPAGFSLASNLTTTSLVPGQSTTFVVRLDATSQGTYSGGIEFANNDADENPFNLTLQGSVSAPLPAPSIQIVDDGDVGFATSGNWSRATGQGFRNDVRFTAAGNGNDSAQWIFPVTPGRFRVATTWSPHPNRATDATYRISAGNNQVGQASVNQEQVPNDFTDQGRSWRELGTFDIASNTLRVDLDDAANEFVIADAVRIERIGELGNGTTEPEIQVVDNQGSQQVNVNDNGTIEFGATAQGQPVDKVLTVRNTGTDVLSLTPLLAGDLPFGFRLVSNFGTTSLVPGQATTFAIRMEAQSPGNYSGPLAFVNNDADENPFNVLLRGSVTAAPPTPVVQIIDDGDVGFTTSGSWRAATRQGFQNDVRFTAAGVGNDVARWSFQVSPGRYRVAASWSAHPNRATDATYRVLAGNNLVGQAEVNQEQWPNDFRDGSGGWKELGSFDVDSNTLLVELNDAANEYVIADAVRIERVGDLGSGTTGPEIEIRDNQVDVADNGVVDFGNTEVGQSVEKTLTVRNLGTSNLRLTPLQASSLPVGFSLVSNLTTTSLVPGQSTTLVVRLDANSQGSFSGPVQISNNDADENPFDLTLQGSVTTTPPQPVVRIIDNGDLGFATSGAWSTATRQGFQNDVHFTSAGTGSREASWSFPVSPGRYRVAATWSAHPNRATDATYDVRAGNNVVGQVAVNQEQSPADFTDQGRGWRELGSFDINSTTLVVQLDNSANEYVIADAVRIERIGDLGTGTTEPEIQVLASQVDLADGGVLDLGSTILGQPVERTLTVRNVGTANLFLTPLLPGNLPNGFSLASNFTSTSLLPGQSTTFAVRLDATTMGSFSGPIEFANNDANENPFNVRLQGSVIVAPPASTVHIIDNGEAGFSSLGNWAETTGLGFQNDLQFTAPGTGSDVARWMFQVSPGRYRVATTWAVLPNSATDAAYGIFDGTVATSGSLIGGAEVNQELNPTDFAAEGVIWKDLGTVQTTTGMLLVTLDDEANEFVVADAVRIERLDDVGGGSGQVGITISPTSSLQTTETGGTDSFTVVLDAPPLAQVQMAVQSSNTAEGFVQPSTLVFNQQNWMVPQTVTVTGIDDFITDGPGNYRVLVGPAVSTDPRYDGLDPFDPEVVNLDDDTGGIAIDAVSGLRTSESGDSSTFRVRLESPPTAPVNIGISSSDTTEGTVYPTFLQFDASNWGTDQLVTITGVDDELNDGDVSYVVNIAAAVSADPNYNGRRPVSLIPMVNEDNDAAELILSPSTEIRAQEGGSPASLMVSLSAQPTGTVIVGVTNSRATQAFLSTNSLQFDSTNWNQPQVVSVTAIDDSILDGDLPFTISVAVTSATDPAFFGLLTQVNGVAEDNDQLPPGINVTQTGVQTNELGGELRFDVRLNSPPATTVRVPINSGDFTEGALLGPNGELTASQELVFSPVNWNTPQTVTVRSVDDNECDGDVSYGISVGPATSTDSSYDGLSGSTVSVTNVDNEECSAGVDRFDGNYVGSFDGEASGDLAFAVAAGLISVSTPFVGTGTVDAFGFVSIGGDSPSMGSCFYAGTLIEANGSANGSGSWVCPRVPDVGIVTGSWSVARGSALRALGTPGSAPAAEPLSSEQVDAILASSRSGWMNAQEAEVPLPEAIKLLVTDLPGDLVGAATSEAIYLDTLAAGHGWFLDATPDLNEEFQPAGEASTLRAKEGGPAVDRIDLLTVLSHELGHLLGWPDVDHRDAPDDLMADALEPGTRRMHR